MPIYEYVCGACGHETEIMQKFGETAPTTCNSCGSEGRVARKLSRTSFHLRGDGWASGGYGSGPGYKAAMQKGMDVVEKGNSKSSSSTTGSSSA